MNTNELYFKKVISAIGWTMLIFWAFLQGFGIVIAPFQTLLAAFLPSPVLVESFYQILYGAGYMLSFMLPVFFLSVILKGRGCQPRPIAMKPQVSPYLPLFVFATVAICFAASRLNGFMVQFFRFSDFSSEYLWSDMNKSAPYQVVLNFIVISIVPGFCEEFLFRGAILGNLLPFGRTNAVLISSLLFALMHQNPEQLFYTFVIGILLGILYERTGSIWVPTLVHVINNFISIFERAILYSGMDSVAANVTIFIIDTVIYILGFLSIGWLVVRFFGKKDPLESGVYGNLLPMSDAYAERPLAQGRVARLLCSPPLVIFAVLCVGQILLLLLIAMMGGALVW